jgi:hypothetical protein
LKIQRLGRARIFGKNAFRAARRFLNSLVLYTVGFTERPSVEPAASRAQSD